jgi:hypothetical protein
VGITFVRIPAKTQKADAHVGTQVPPKPKPNPPSDPRPKCFTCGTRVSPGQYEIDTGTVVCTSCAAFKRVISQPRAVLSAISLGINERLYRIVRSAQDHKRARERERAMRAVVEAVDSGSTHVLKQQLEDEKRSKRVEEQAKIRSKIMRAPSVKTRPRARMTGPGMRGCVVCTQSKPLSEYQKYGRAGYRSVCNACMGVPSNATKQSAKQAKDTTHVISDELDTLFKRVFEPPKRDTRALDRAIKQQLADEKRAEQVKREQDKAIREQLADEKRAERAKREQDKALREEIKELIRRDKEQAEALRNELQARDKALKRQAKIRQKIMAGDKPGDRSTTSKQGTPEGWRECLTCRELKRIATDFHKHGARSYRNVCKVCAYQRAKELKRPPDAYLYVSKDLDQLFKVVFDPPSLAPDIPDGMECRTCKRLLPQDAFNTRTEDDTSNPTGRAYSCRACEAELRIAAQNKPKPVPYIGIPAADGCHLRNFLRQHETERGWSVQERIPVVRDDMPDAVAAYLRSFTGR